ncbi:MAG: T9SS type A sorting domain-containing protein [Saprospiraceae bacterium]
MRLYRWPVTASPHGGVTLEMDADEDGDIDLWLGSSAFNSLNLLTNAGNCTAAWINAQNTDALAPSGTLPSFPTAYHLDANNDGLKDLLVCPSFRLAANDRRAVVWRYQNTGTVNQPVFVFQENDFMVADMVDLGTGAHPAFADINADGLLDLVIGNTSLASDYEAYQSRIFLFLNTGTPQAPVFTLINEDFLEMSQFEASSNSFAPTFGDLDGDGDLDLLIGEWLGGLFFAENTAGTGQPMEFSTPVYGYQSIDVGQFSTPHILDITGDGLPDLLIGERNGNINFFPNLGSIDQPVFIGNPAILPNNSHFGDIDTRIPGMASGHSSPFVIKLAADEYRLLTGTEYGAIEVYQFTTTALEETFQQVADFSSPSRIGIRTNPFLADVNGDGQLELWLGNQSGGLIAFESEWEAITSPNNTTQSTLKTQAINIYPNPTKDLLTITAQNQPSSFSTWHIFDMAGHCVQKGALYTTTLSIDISHLAKGVYYLSVVTDYANSVQRFIVQ